MIKTFPKSLGHWPDAQRGTARCPRVGNCASAFGKQKKVPNPQGGFILGNDLEGPLRFNPAPNEMRSHSQILVRNRQRELFPQSG